MNTNKIRRIIPITIRESEACDNTLLITIAEASGIDNTKIASIIE
jgi:hypothetical protein